MDLDILLKKIETQAHRAANIRSTLKSTYAWQNDDARVTLFRKLTGVLNTVQIAYFLEGQTIWRKDWWATFQTAPVSEEDIKGAIEQFEMFLKIGLIHDLMA